MAHTIKPGARSYGPYVASPPLAGALEVDVAVIGAGFTGLSTALEFKRDSPAATVAVLEGAVVGYGASGRNGGFNMKLFGLEPEVTKLRWGRERTIEAHRYAQRAVAWVKKLIEDNQLESDFRHTGMLRVSYSPSQLERLRRTYRLMQELGIDDATSFRTQAELRQEFATDRYLGAIYERETGIMNPSDVAGWPVCHLTQVLTCQPVPPCLGSRVLTDYLAPDCRSRSVPFGIVGTLPGEILSGFVANPVVFAIGFSSAWI